MSGASSAAAAAQQTAAAASSIAGSTTASTTSPQQQQQHQQNTSTLSSVPPTNEESKFHELFPLIPHNETLVGDYQCSLSRKKILRMGRIYLTSARMCFYAQFPREEFMIEWQYVTSIEKKSNMLFEAVVVTTTDKASHFFTAFAAQSTDSALKLMVTLHEMRAKYLKRSGSSLGPQSAPQLAAGAAAVSSQEEEKRGAVETQQQQQQQQQHQQHGKEDEKTNGDQQQPAKKTSSLVKPRNNDVSAEVEAKPRSATAPLASSTATEQQEQNRKEARKVSPQPQPQQQQQQQHQAEKKEGTAQEDEQKAQTPPPSSKEPAAAAVDTAEKSSTTPLESQQYTTDNSHEDKKKEKGEEVAASVAQDDTQKARTSSENLVQPSTPPRSGAAAGSDDSGGKQQDQQQQPTSGNNNSFDNCSFAARAAAAAEGSNISEASPPSSPDHHQTPRAGSSTADNNSTSTNNASIADPGSHYKEQYLQYQRTQIHKESSRQKDRSREILKHFPDVPQNEIIIDTFQCSYVSGVHRIGKLHITSNYVLFNSVMLSEGVRIKISQIVSLEKATNFLLLEGIQIATRSTKKPVHEFTSFLNRENAFSIMQQLVAAHHSRALVVEPETDNNESDDDAIASAAEQQPVPADVAATHGSPGGQGAAPAAAAGERELLTDSADSSSVKTSRWGIKMGSKKKKLQQQQQQPPSDSLIAEQSQEEEAATTTTSRHSNNNNNKGTAPSPPKSGESTPTRGGKAASASHHLHYKKHSHIKGSKAHQRQLQRASHEPVPPFATSTADPNIPYPEVTSLQALDDYVTDFGAGLSNIAQMMDREILPLQHFPVGYTVNDVFRSCFDDETSLMDAYHAQRRDTNIVWEKWRPCVGPKPTTHGGQRQLKCTTVIRAMWEQLCPFHEFQKFALLVVQGTPTLLAQFSGQATGVAFSETFRAETLMVFREEKAAGSAQPQVNLRVYGHLQWLRSVIIKGKITSTAFNEMPECYRKLSLMALERVATTQPGPSSPLASSLQLQLSAYEGEEAESEEETPPRSKKSSASRGERGLLSKQDSGVISAATSSSSAPRQAFTPQQFPPPQPQQELVAAQQQEKQEPRSAYSIGGSVAIHLVALWYLVWALWDVFCLHAELGTASASSASPLPSASSQGDAYQTALVIANAAPLGASLVEALRCSLLFALWMGADVLVRRFERIVAELLS